MSLNIYTPNLLSTSQCAVVSGAANEVSKELFCSLKEVLNSHSSPKGDNIDSTQLSIYPPKSNKEEELKGKELEVTVKLFYLDPTEETPNPNYINSAMTAVLEHLGINKVDLLVLAFHGIYLQDDSEAALSKFNKEDIFACWKAMEKENLSGRAVELAVSEFSKPMLQDLLDVSEVKPSANQVNLSDCCIIPRSLREFAKEKSVKLFTHNDPNDLVPSTEFTKLLKDNSSLLEDQSITYQPKWAARYSVNLKSRGIVASRGYIVNSIKVAS